ncbi:MAG: PQQ-binding-like beta-propeller repeat protein [Verrucomicrobiales bacterium]
MKFRHFLIFVLMLRVPGVAVPPLLDRRQPDKSPEVIWSTYLGSMGEITVAGDVVLAGATNGGIPNARTSKQWANLILIPPQEEHDEHDNAVFCLDARTGTLRWRAAHPQVYDRRRGLPNFPITSRPEVDGDRVYYLTVASELVCADLEGFYDGENDGPFLTEELTGKTDADIVWRIDLQSELGVQPRGASDVGYVQSSPLVIGDLVYVVTGNGSDRSSGSDKVPAPGAPSFLAVDKRTGRIAWSSNAPGANIILLNNGSPASMSNGETVVFPGGDGLLYGFEAASGKLQWNADMNALGGTKNLFFETRPMIWNDLVITSLRSSIEGGPQKGAPLIAVRPDKVPEPAWIFGKELGGFWWQMVVQDGVLYAVSAPNILHAIDPASGKEHWQVKVGSGSDPWMLYGAPGRLFLSSMEGEFVIVKLGADTPTVETFEMAGVGAYGPPTLSGHGLFVPSRAGLFLVRCW